MFHLVSLIRGKVCPKQAFLRVSPKREVDKSASSPIMLLGFERDVHGILLDFGPLHQSTATAPTWGQGCGEISFDT